MLTSKKNAGDISPRCRSLMAVQTVLMAITALLAIQDWSVGRGRLWEFLAGLCACSAVSLIFRMGWVVPCTIIGLGVGAFLDGPIKGGTYESQMWETVRSICGGAAAGFFVGLGIDCIHLASENDGESSAEEPTDVLGATDDLSNSEFKH